MSEPSDNMSSHPEQSDPDFDEEQALVGDVFTSGYKSQDCKIHLTFHSASNDPDDQERATILAEYEGFEGRDGIPVALRFFNLGKAADTPYLATPHTQRIQLSFVDKPSTMSRHLSGLEHDVNNTRLRYENALRLLSMTKATDDELATLNQSEELDEDTVKLKNQKQKLVTNAEILAQQLRAQLDSLRYSAQLIWDKYEALQMTQNLVDDHCGVLVFTWHSDAPPTRTRSFGVNK